VLQQSVISPLPEVLTKEEEEAVLKAAEKLLHASKSDARPYTLLLLLLTTGIKKGECLTLSTNHLELSDASAPYLFVRYANSSNRYKERKISLSDAWIESYRVYPQPI